MIRLGILALALVLLVPSRAHSYAYTCDEAAFYGANGSPSTQGAIVGHAFGVVDFLAGLQCFVGNPQCSCLSNLVSDRPGDFGGEYGRQLAQCVRNGQGSDPVFGVVLRAARTFCPW